MKPPMRYPGNKYASLPHILGHLPYRNSFIDVFGGSASVLLGRRPHALEVYNDAHSGITDFYRALRDHLPKLVERLELVLHSREEWQFCKDHWNDPNIDIVERAARWYYCVQTSYAGIDRAWMRSLTKRNEVAAQYRGKIELFPTIHERFRNVEIENKHWQDIVYDYDNPMAVFYFDPPYYEQSNEHYKHGVNHEKLLDVIFEIKGFAALSGYPTPLYEERAWDHRYEWKRPAGMASGQSTEVLWVKE